MKLGMIGMSEGNGHPYSWSAIFNHYDDAAMKSSPFTVIYDYLSQQKWPDDYIGNAKVTHIWTQEKLLSERIALASNIPHIADNFIDMIGEIDGLLLARDDYQNHDKFARPFLEAGLPIYIDKPLANSVSGANTLFSLQRYEGQIFTCSALRYAREFETIQKHEISRIEASTPKSWSLYGIHIIEPVFALLGDVSDMRTIRREKNGDAVRLELETSGRRIVFQSTGQPTGKIDYHFCFKDGSSQSIQVSDYFYAFKSALLDFLKCAQTRSNIIDRAQTLSIIKAIEMGAEGV